MIPEMAFSEVKNSTLVGLNSIKCQNQVIYDYTRWDDVSLNVGSDVPDEMMESRTANLSRNLQYPGVTQV